MFMILRFGWKRFCEEIGQVICGLYITDAQGVVFDLFSYVEVATIDVFSSVVVFWVVC